MFRFVGILLIASKRHFQIRRSMTAEFVFVMQYIVRRTLLAVDKQDITV